ncbi:sterol desaturase family protein [Nocardia sp. GP40]|uniref:sterol desaturase family protein n=1 Tax=Nocardia sp. GP40 TaxID=3156268 RepID=UPI003D1B3E8F
MFDLILHAIPVFVLCVVLEALSFRYLADDDELGYESRDTRTSLAMGIGSSIINIGWKLVVVATYAGLYLLAPVHLPTHNPLTWVGLFFADEIAYYWYHRTHHTIRLFWASHVVHHSSRRYNLSTALRQPWTPFTALPYWAPLALLGFPPWMILLQQSISLLYQFFVHTERVGMLWRPLEFVMNTPSHHRAHHGSNTQYLDRNYGGILAIAHRTGSGTGLGIRLPAAPAHFGARRAVAEMITTQTVSVVKQVSAPGDADMDDAVGRGWRVVGAGVGDQPVRHPVPGVGGEFDAVVVPTEVAAHDAAGDRSRRRLGDESELLRAHQHVSP